MLKFVSEYSDNFDKINDEIVLGIRKQDNIAFYLDEACEEIAKTLPENIKYLGYEYDDNIKRTKEINKSKELKEKDSATIINVKNTLSRTAIYKFQLSFKGEKQFAHVPIHIPQLIDNFHYFIRGNKYSTPLQITDSITYPKNENSVTLKTMVRVVKLNKEKTIIEDIFGNNYRTYYYNIYMSKEIPMLMYWFAHFGFYRTFEFFGADKYVNFYDGTGNNKPDTPSSDELYFNFGDVILGVDSKIFKEDYKFREFIASILFINRKNLKYKLHIRNANYWKTMIGKYISDKNGEVRGRSLLESFIKALDNRTKTNIKQNIGGSDRDSTFAVVRWMFFNFEELSSKSNNLLNKRVRLGEYLITPFIKRAYQKIYHFMNAADNIKDFRRLQDIFKISPSIIVNAIIGKTKANLSLNIAKYSAPVNDLVLLNSGTKITKGGPGSPMENDTKRLGPNYRDFDTSYIGKICLITTATSDPGISGGNINPMADFDLEKLRFYKSDE